MVCGDIVQSIGVVALFDNHRVALLPPLVGRMAGVLFIDYEE